MKKAYTPLSKNQFQAALVVAKGKSAAYVAAIQDLALASIYHAMSNNDHRKACQVYALLDTSHRNRFMQYVVNNSNLGFATSEIKKEYKLTRGKDWPTGTFFFIKKAVNRQDEAIRNKALAHCSNISEVLWLTYKAPKNDALKPLEFMPNLAKVIKRSESERYEATDLEQRQIRALNTFMDYIEKGYTLNDAIERELKKRNSAIVVPASIDPIELQAINNEAKTA